jgi:hypothetical protein
MRKLMIFPALAIVLACADTNPMQPSTELDRLNSVNAPKPAVKASVSFFMEVSVFGDAMFKDLGQSGRGMIRDYHLTFDVTGDLVGTAHMVLNSNWDADIWWATGPGRGSTWGALTIDNGGEIWEGKITGEFVLFPDLHPWNPQLFSKINLHGPDGRKLKAACDETSPESEVVACTGEVLSPKG